MASVLILNGPNLNLLGSRSPEIYGTTTFAELEELCRREAGPEVQAGRSIGAVLNPGALTHTSIALRDAIEAVRLPVIEVHISNVRGREEFRHQSWISPVARGIIIGLGIHGYPLAIRALHLLSGTP